MRTIYFEKNIPKIMLDLLPTGILWSAGVKQFKPPVTKTAEPLRLCWTIVAKFNEKLKW